MRLFVAVDPGPRALGVLVPGLAELSRAAPRARWVRPDGLHMTLAFLGETPPERVEALRGALGRAASRSRAFSLALGGVGAFPSWSAPRVVWVGVAAGAQELGRLQNAVREELSAAGFPLENRDFHGHATLCRVKSPRDARGLREAAERWAASADWGRGEPVTEIRLWSSRLTPEGAAYSEVSRHGLAQA